MFSFTFYFNKTEQIFLYIYIWLFFIDDKYVFIRKIEVLLNGTPIDQIEDKQNEDECLQAYWRMFAFNGQINSLFTNGISYDDFRFSF